MSSISTTVWGGNDIIIYWACAIQQCRGEFGNWEKCRCMVEATEFKPAFIEMLSQLSLAAIASNYSQ